MKDTPLRELERALGYEFKKTETITEALTHRSHHHEYNDSPHNERLEFLGDAVLDLCVTELVMGFAPATNEGHLSRLRSQLVSETSLARAARELGIGKYVRLGRGEESSGGRERDSLLADTLEAILAAIYIDGGLEASKCIVSRVLALFLTDAQEWASRSWNLITTDYKSRLQEFCQSLGFGTPSYSCLETLGPDHQKTFTMGLFIRGIEVSRAQASTKKEATQLAAQKLLEMDSAIGVLEEHMYSLGIPKQALESPKKKGSKNDKDYPPSIESLS